MKLIASLFVVVLIVTAAAAQSTDWLEVHSDEGRFTVLMPDKPVEELVTVSKDGTADRHSNTFTCTDNALNQFMVAYSDRTGSEPRRRTNAQLYDKVRDGLLTATGAKFVRESTVKLNGFLEGREIVTQQADGTVQTMRLFMVGDRIYQVSAEIKKGETADAAKFLNSFRLTS